jgi:hypothetical protein
MTLHALNTSTDLPIPTTAMLAAKAEEIARELQPITYASGFVYTALDQANSADLSWYRAKATCSFDQAGILKAMVISHLSLRELDCEHILLCRPLDYRFASEEEDGTMPGSAGCAKVVVLSLVASGLIAIGCALGAHFCGGN